MQYDPSQPQPIPQSAIAANLQQHSPGHKVKQREAQREAQRTTSGYGCRQPGCAIGFGTFFFSTGIASCIVGYVFSLFLGHTLDIYCFYIAGIVLTLAGVGLCVFGCLANSKKKTNVENILAAQQTTGNQVPLMTTYTPQQYPHALPPGAAPIAGYDAPQPGGQVLHPPPNMGGPPQNYNMGAPSPNMGAPPHNYNMEAPPPSYAMV